jgi:ankyrin repeat protein
MRLTTKQTAWLQEAYNYYFDLGDEDLPSFDPATWQSPEGDRIINIAALRGDFTAVEILVTAGEDVDVIGDMGQTPAHFAAMGQHRDVFDFLMQSGADATVVDEFGRTSPQTWTLFEKLERPSSA